MMYLKKLFCKHEFHLLSAFKMDTDPTIGYKLEEMVIIYCPKCKKEETVTQARYECILTKQRIDREYFNERK